MVRSAPVISDVVIHRQCQGILQDGVITYILTSDASEPTGEVIAREQVPVYW